MNPIEEIIGEIVDISPGTLTIKASYDNWRMLTHRQYKKVYIELVDSRPLSDKQRKMCFAMIGEISEWQGQSRSETVKDMVNYARKVDFLINELGENADRLFSLSNAPMSLVAEYQKYLVRFIIENNIPTKKPLLEYADDISDYVYYSMINKKCVVCGAPAQLHHIDRVGMGRDREEIIHEGMEALSLCGKHHEEAHTMPDNVFFNKYHLDCGIVLDRTLCKIYKVKGRDKRAQ